MDNEGLQKSAITSYEQREILFYKTDNGDVRVQILLYQENLWLTICYFQTLKKYF